MRLRGVLERAAIVAKARGRLRISGHEEDKRIYECAVAAKANYLVTENRKDFVSARQLLAVVEPRRKLRD